MFLRLGFFIYLHLFSGCLGCASEHDLLSSADLREHNHQERKVCKYNSISSDYFWNSNSSASDIQTCAVPSQGGISPLATSKCSAFVNHGLLLWNQTRQQWIGHKSPSNHTDDTCEPRLSWNATCESMLGSNTRYPKPIPLPVHRR